MSGTDMNIQAVLLAGARTGSSPLVRGTPYSNKVLLPVAGKPMLQWVLEAVSASRHRLEVFISAQSPDEIQLEPELPYSWIPAGHSPVDSFLGALDALAGADRVLVVSGDHPLLTCQMVDYFVEEALRHPAALTAAVVDKDCVRAHYPHSRRTFFSVKGGAFSGGNLFLVDLKAFDANRTALEHVDRNRKRPWMNLGQNLGQLGVKTVLDVILRRIDIHELVGRLSDLIGCEAGVVEMPFAECCMDVDKPSDLVIAEAILKQRLSERGAWAPVAV